MRVTENLRTQVMMRQLIARSEKLNELYGKLATQRDVQVPSDDPARSGTIMRVTSHINELQQTIQSLAAAQSFIEAAEEFLNAEAESMTRIKTLALRAANATLSEHDRLALAEELNQLIEAMVEYGNQTFEGRFVFSGASTDTQPLVVERDSTGEIASVSYQGSTTQLEFPIGRNRRMAVSVTGRAIFFDSGAFESAIALRDHLRNAEGMSEQELLEALRQDLSKVEAASNAILVESGRLGCKAAEVEVLSDQAKSAVTRAQEVIARVRDADIAQVAVDLKREETVYQALLNVGAKIMQTTLMDYL